MKLMCTTEAVDMSVQGNDVQNDGSVNDQPSTEPVNDQPSTEPVNDQSTEPVNDQSTEPVNDQPVDGVPEPTQLNGSDVEFTEKTTADSDNAEDNLPEVDGYESNDEQPSDETSVNINIKLTGPSAGERLLWAAFKETLFMWLIIFDYSILFPTKLFCNRVKNGIFDTFTEGWTKFANHVAKFQYLVTNRPEFTLVFSVLTLEIMMLIRNCCRSVRCLKDMYQDLKVD